MYDPNAAREFVANFSDLYLTRLKNRPTSLSRITKGDSVVSMQTSEYSGSTDRAKNNRRVNKAIEELDKYGIKYTRVGFEEVPVLEVEIDPSYQRNLTLSRVQVFAKSWNWVLCNTIILSVRPDGSKTVVDGMHRTEGLRKKDPTAKIPAMLFRFDSVEEEAKAFALLNTTRRKASSLSKIRALSRSGDKTADFIFRLIAGTGRVPGEAGASSNTVACMGTLYRMAINDKRALNAVWSMMVQLCHGEVFHGDLLSGLCYLETVAQAQQETICDPASAKRWLKIGYPTLVAAIEIARAQLGKGGEKTHAYGLQTRFNKDRNRDNHLQLVTAELH